ncbi:glycoside hydrolase superfamily [Neohortaea acidophila]|uniref:mannan endo-1,4-beta-mannosidase n=1 Tax=Neohortaea acidophila TaxID=245834 RepID=A0A6A6PWY6_9PEZI|nr:glycoside hydrolase superfamily [Neohortaea acidophila]KAF2484261.1 glycoside hydrolase superfamily [Neohortaea acidophila]
MLLCNALLFAAVACAAKSTSTKNQYVTRNGSQLLLNGKPWTASGGNVYWLGIDQNVVPPAGQPYAPPASYPTQGRITEIMSTLVTMGAHAFRSTTMGVSVGYPLSLEPELGQWNDQAFDTIDWAVYQAGLHGLRLFAPLIDNYDYYHGGKFVFLRWFGIDISSSATPLSPLVMEFYNNQTIVDAFKTYIEHLLAHKNQYTNLTYAEDPTIFAYETGNELGGPVFGDMDVPPAWTDEICSYIKQLAPKKLCIDGTYGINKTHLTIDSVDIMSDHFYPPNIAKLNSDIALAGGANKAYIAGEYDWTGNVRSAAPLQSWFGVTQNNTNVVAGDLFWSLFMHDVPNCSVYVDHDDGFTMHYGDPNNTAHNNTQIRTVRKHLFELQGKQIGNSFPPVQCP